ncbi:MAG: hypothetical protein AAF757_10905 [Cyanobacteria bacterium P01_D01_bin.116]
MVICCPYKTKGRIDESGNLIVETSIPLPAGDVEIIILRVEEVDSSKTVLSKKI